MSIIKKPLITEKFSAMAEKENKYGFVVDKKATKEEIKKVIEKVFKVAVVDVNTMVYSGKPKYRYTKKNILEGKTSGYKKAIITLKEGDKIDFYSNI
jgi:large subunit ribosomal protein L23